MSKFRPKKFQVQSSMTGCTVHRRMIACACVDLVADLFDSKVLSCGTIRSNRKKLPKDLIPDKVMTRGESDCRQSGQFHLVKWLDNKPVTLISSICSGVNEITVVRRRKGEASQMQVKCPEMIQDYNSYMGGVDLMDQKNSVYALDRWSKIKFYLRPFFDLLDISLTNSYIVWTKLHPESKMTSLNFRRHVARDLIILHKTRTTRVYGKRSFKKASTADMSAEQHLPEIQEKKRCRLCADNKMESRTTVVCCACKVHLCLTKDRNCFKEFLD